MTTILDSRTVQWCIDVALQRASEHDMSASLCKEGDDATKKEMMARAQECRIVAANCSRRSGLVLTGSAGSGRPDTKVLTPAEWRRRSQMIALGDKSEPETREEASLSNEIHRFNQNAWRGHNCSRPGIKDTLLPVPSWAEPGASVTSEARIGNTDIVVVVSVRNDVTQIHFKSHAGLVGLYTLGADRMALIDINVTATDAARMIRQARSAWCEGQLDFQLSTHQQP